MKGCKSVLQFRWESLWISAKKRGWMQKCTMYVEGGTLLYEPLGLNQAWSLVLKVMSLIVTRDRFHLANTS